MSEPFPPLPNIEDLIDGAGQITIGAIEPVQCAAVALYESRPLTMLVRRDGESFVHFLTRLDTAIDLAHEEEIFIDEINNGPNDRL